MKEINWFKLAIFENNIFFHVTTIENYESIKKIGLIPNYNINWDKDSKKGYVYLTGTSGHAYSWAKWWLNDFPDTPTKALVILQVSIPDLNKLAGDTNFIGGDKDDFQYFGEIPPQNIKLLKTYTVVSRGKPISPNAFLDSYRIINPDKLVKPRYLRKRNNNEQ